MRVLRLIVYQGDLPRLRSTLERSWPDGVQLGGHIVVRTLDGEDLADLKLRHPDWETGDPSVQPLLHCKVLPGDLIEDLKQFLDRYVDVNDDDDGQPVPNTAMRLLARLEA